jgi:hypothetical protein
MNHAPSQDQAAHRSGGSVLDAIDGIHTIERAVE